MDGLVARQEKPSNTEMLGELMDSDKIRFITNLTPRNVKGLFRLSYFLKRLKQPEKESVEVLEETISECLEHKCSVQTKKGNRADQVVDALKHIIEDENKDQLSSIAAEIKK